MKIFKDCIDTQLSKHKRISYIKKKENKMYVTLNKFVVFLLLSLMPFNLMAGKKGISHVCDTGCKAIVMEIVRYPDRLSLIKIEVTYGEKTKKVSIKNNANFTGKEELDIGDEIVYATRYIDSDCNYKSRGLLPKQTLPIPKKPETNKLDLQKDC